MSPTLAQALPEKPENFARALSLGGKHRHARLGAALFAFAKKNLVNLRMLVFVLDLRAAFLDVLAGIF
jgi:hypothetical protein